MERSVALLLSVILAAGCLQADPPSTSPEVEPVGGGVPIFHAPPGAPKVSFTFTPGTVEENTTVRFVDASVAGHNDTITAWKWAFGDGQSADSRNVGHGYAVRGIYDVRLTVTTATGLVASASKVVVVRAANAPPAGIEPPTITSTARGLVLYLAAQFSGTATDYRWDFGDGSTGSGERVVHVFDQPGEYAVHLIADTADGPFSAPELVVRLEGLPISFFLSKTGGVGGEPSIGITSAGVAFTAVNPRAFRSLDGGKTWAQVSTQLSAPTGFDPYLWVDVDTDRVFHDNLSILCSTLSWSDDLGVTWTTNPVACGLPVNDHQKLATGAPRAGAALQPVGYPNLVYYAASDFATGTIISVSPDGGLTWIGNRAGIPNTCGSGGTNGQPHANQAGMVFVPYYDCGWLYAARSANNGVSWTPIVVDRLNGWGLWDPDLASDAQDVTYIASQGAGYDVFYAYTTDEGSTWSPMVQVQPSTLALTLFPTVVAGADGRLAISYLGTTTNATSPSLVPEDALWHLYTTFVQDASTAQPALVTIQVTPDPVHIGHVCLGGITCDTPGGDGDKRNLLEFIDSVLDPTTGRLWITYTLGCDGCSTSAESVRSINMVARIDAGPSLTGPESLLPL